MSKVEKNYVVTDKDDLAMTFTVKHFKPYIHGAQFTTKMDHAPLKALQSNKDLTCRLTRRAFSLQEYEFQIMYKHGKLNQNADALTRTKGIEHESYSTYEDVSRCLMMREFGHGCC